MNSPKADRKKCSASERLSVEELRKKYEPLITGNRETTPTFEQLKQKYETNIKAKETRVETDGLVKISKVQQITSMFNSKVNAVIKRESYKRHKISPDAKSPTKCDLPQPWPMPEVNNNKEKSPVPSPRMKTEPKANQPKPWPLPRANSCKEETPIARPRTKSDSKANQPKPWPLLRANSCKEETPTAGPRTKSETKANQPKPWPMPRANSCKEEAPIARPRTKSETKAHQPKPWPMPRANSCKETSPTARPKTELEPQADLPKPWPMPRANSCKETSPTVRPKTELEPQADLPKPWPVPRANSCQESPPIARPRTKIPDKSAYFAIEEHFAKLSVKDKALLYTQFIGDMTKKNPKFVKHAKILEADVLKEINRAEVIDEKQSTVKDLLQELEARCSFPKQFVSPLALQYVNTLEEAKVVASKEFEKQQPDDEEKPLRATLSFNVQPNPAAETKKVRRRARSLPRCHVKDEHILKELSTIEPSVKRPNDQMRSYLPIEAYAPPKKIRRTRAEVLSTQTSAKDQHMQNLFYTWLNEKQQGNEEETQSDSETKSTSTIDKLLEETIDKLETLDENLPVPPTESTDNKEYISTSSSKPSETEESESGITPLTKITSEESQADNCEKKSEISENDLTAAKFLRPLRKKRLRRTLAWKKEANVEEARPQGSTDSDSDSKLKESKAKNKLIYIQVPQATEKSSLVPANANNSKRVASFMELNKSFLKKINSPRKIKSAYTLTVCSPPPGQEEPSSNDELDCTLTNETTLPLTPEADHTIDTPTKEENPSMTDSFIDQGFETGTNDMDSPIRAPRKSDVKKSEVQQVEPLFIQLPRLEGKTNETPSDFSTPIKGHTKQANNFACSLAAQPEQVISPITMPLKTRTRRCTNDNEPRHSTHTMEVIREDQMLEHHEITSHVKLNNTNASSASFTNISDLNAGKTSQFWIKSGGICISLDIFYNTAERVRLLYEIFSQKSFESRDIHFGIDDHKFSIQHGEDEENISKRLPNNQECSHYWFSSGDLAVPFSGKIMAPEKIQRLFEFVKTSVEETGILRFGVDNVEFSNVPEFWNPSPRFSMDSNYSILVGLQSGNSNGLEGRSKFSWPNRRSVKVTDLDESVDYDNQNFEENECCRLSFSPFGNNSYDLANINPEAPSMQCRNDDIKTPDTFLMSFENDSLDQLFAENYNPQAKTTDKNNSNANYTTTTSTTVPEMLCTLKSQQQRLSDVKERLSIYCKPINKTTHDALDALKGTPEYVQKLKSIVTDILKISNTTGFKDSTVEELEYYMFYLSRYADICLHDCSDHMDKVLDALMEKKVQQLVN